MPQIAPFRGLRYDLGHVGSLDQVVAPPYDVIDADFQDRLYQQHPANIVRLILNREEPGDPTDAKYGRAARFLKQWRQEGVLQQDSAAGLYVYHQVFTYEGTTYTRRGFMCRCRLERFGEGTIYPHEETHASAKTDRLKLTRACRANLSQVFGIYPDPEGEAQGILEESIRGQTPLEARDHLGVLHRMWHVTDLPTINRVAAAMIDKPTFIADGHHRYETACNYRDELGAEASDSQHAANYVLMMCVGMDDPGMIVLPTHRLFRGIPAISSDQLKGILSNAFDVRVAGEGIDLAPSIWEQIEMEGKQETIGFYCHEDSRWLVATLNNSGKAKMAEVSTDHSQDWQSLGVSILQRLVMEHLLGEKNYPKPKYVHLISEVVESLESGDVEEGSGPFPLTALVMPATLQHIRSISEHHERMPAKSTYFYPKLLSGLVINLH